MVCGKDKKKGNDSKTKPPTSKDSKTRSTSADKNSKNSTSPAKGDSQTVSNNVSIWCDWMF